MLFMPVQGRKLHGFFDTKGLPHIVKLVGSGERSHAVVICIVSRSGKVEPVCNLSGDVTDPVGHLEGVMRDMAMSIHGGAAIIRMLICKESGLLTFDCKD